MKRTLVCFDVNETLLDFGALDPVFEPVGGPAARHLWFAQVLVSAMALTHVNRYLDFSELGQQALRSVAVRFHWRLPADFASALRQRLASLPAHADATAALSRLREAGYHVAALTNSPLEGVRRQLQQAGLVPCFDAILSVEAVRRYKPAEAPYAMAARHFNVSTAGMWMVAAHDWDILGAEHAGCSGVFVGRGDDRFPDAWPGPTGVARTLVDAADLIISADRSEE